MGKADQPLASRHTSFMFLLVWISFFPGCLVPCLCCQTVYLLKAGYRKDFLLNFLPILHLCITCRSLKSADKIEIYFLGTLAAFWCKCSISVHELVLVV